MKNTVAEKYRERAKELRELAAAMKNENHGKLLLESAERYEQLAKEAGKPS